MILAPFILLSAAAAIVSFFRDADGEEQRVKASELQPEQTTDTRSHSTTRGDRGEPDKPEDALVVSRAKRSASATDQAKAKVDHYLAVSSGSLGLAIIGAFLHPVFSLVSTCLGVYALVPLFRRGYRDVVKERRMSIAVVDSLGCTSVLLGGYYVLSGLGLVLFFLGRRLLIETEDRSRRDMISIFGLQQETAWVLVDGVEIQVEIADLHPGDLAVVRAGQVIPVDGIIVQGSAKVDQRALTGESQPVERGVGEYVFAASLVLSGCLHVEVEQAGEMTVSGKIASILNSTADYRSTIDARSEQMANRAAWPLLGLSGLALGTLGAKGAIAVLSSCAIDNVRIGSPLAMLNVLKAASQNGILIKDGRALEMLQDVDTIVFDKTGTLTLEQPELAAIHTTGWFSERELLKYAAAAEVRQSHPIARAILEAACEQGVPLPAQHNVSYQIGFGIEVEVEGQRIHVGSARFIHSLGFEISATLAECEAVSHQHGNLFVYVAVNGELGGAIELRPALRPEVHEVIAQLRARGLSLFILSGDHEAPTRRLAEALGIDQYVAEVLPEGKAAEIQKMQREGRKVCFIGDGINDAIALRTANVSISLRGGTAVAMDSAQMVMMDGGLGHLPQIVDLAYEFNDNLQRSWMISLVASVVSVSGIFFLHFRILTSILLYNASLALVVGNAMLPALRKEKVPPEKETQRL
jgi:heavy metal translocating P-type ATPase